MSQNADLKAFFEDGFYEDYWAHEHTKEISQKEAEQVLHLLGVERGHILDWRGGWGRHAIYFGEKGFQVTILDFIGRYLELAKQRFREKGLKVNTVEADCRNTPASIRADFATCLMNSVGFLEAEEELKAFKSLHSAIRADGKLLVDCMNLFFIAREFKRSFERTGKDGCIYRSQGEFNLQTNVWHKTFEIIRPGGEAVRKEFNQTMYTPHDLDSLVTQAGFEVDDIYGSYDGAPISFEAQKIVLVAHT